MSGRNAIVPLFCALVAAGAGPAEPSAKELLGHARDATSWERSVSMSQTIDQVSTGTMPGNWGHLRSAVTYRRDADRVEWVGSRDLLDGDGKPTPGQGFQTVKVFGNDFYLNASNKPQASRPTAFLQKAHGPDKPSSLQNPSQGRFLEGAMYGGPGEGIFDQLDQSEDLAVVGTKEVNGVTCTVLQGSGRHGTVRAAVAPSLGFNVLEYTITKTGKDLFEGKPLDEIGLTSWVVTVDSVSVQRVGDRYVPVGGRLTHALTQTDGGKRENTFSCKRTDVSLSPDFAAMGAFTIRLPEGTRVNHGDFPGVAYEFRGGRLAPVVDADAIAAIDNAVSGMRLAGGTTAPAPAVESPVAAAAAAPAAPRVSVSRTIAPRGMIAAVAAVAALLAGVVVAGRARARRRG